MGHITHHAIIVTAPEHLIQKARRKARKIFPWVSNVGKGVVNDSSSFLIPPDGSKEGWSDSNTGDNQREEFIEWLRAQAYKDGSNSFEWVELAYGNDDGCARITDHGFDDDPSEK